MKEELQRIAIAEVCGYTLLPISQNSTQRTWQKGGCTVTALPDYLNDLNAMHEAEKVLRPPIRHDWSMWTIYVQRLEEDLHATAKYRAEHFLRTLALWKEEPEV